MISYLLEHALVSIGLAVLALLLLASLYSMLFLEEDDDEYYRGPRQMTDEEIQRHNEALRNTLEAAKYGYGYEVKTWRGLLQAEMEKGERK